ncbi:hypothetical protein BADSM9389_08370 [Buttiauxella agrestis]|nr:hypothetical protein BADSM9389_08370 [Buttiauxella agrestis]
MLVSTLKMGNSNLFQCGKITEWKFNLVWNKALVTQTKINLYLLLSNAVSFVTTYINVTNE